MPYAAASAKLRQPLRWGVAALLVRHYLVSVNRPAFFKGFLLSMGNLGCARMVAVGGALALSVASGGPNWSRLPVEVEESYQVQSDAQAQERAAVEAVLAERSNLTAHTRTRVARAIVEEAADAELDPVFVLALIGVESELDGNAVSSRGAHGLMQLRNATATYLGEKEQMGLGVEAAGDPALNVRIGVRYLHRLIRSFGDLSLALVAYNAGPHRVSAYLHDGDGLPERFIAYPRKVRLHYRKLLGEVAAGSLRVDHPLWIRVAER
jgi:soluble lytic murein transglycosylase-like protein